MCSASLSSSIRILPASNATSPRCNFQPPPPPGCANRNDQLSRPCLSRSRSTLGPTSFSDGMLMVWPISASGSMLKRISWSVAKCGRCAHAGLPMLMSCAVRRGQGTQRASPPESGLRDQWRLRSPLIANGLPSELLTRWSIHGRARFQSNSAMNRMNAISSATMATTIQIRILPKRVMSAPMDSSQAAPHRAPGGGTGEPLRRVRVLDDDLDRDVEIAARICRSVLREHPPGLGEGFIIRRVHEQECATGSRELGVLLHVARFGAGELHQLLLHLLQPVHAFACFQLLDRVPAVEHPHVLVGKTVFLEGCRSRLGVGQVVVAGDDVMGGIEGPERGAAFLEEFL